MTSRTSRIGFGFVFAALAVTASMVLAQAPEAGPSPRRPPLNLSCNLLTEYGVPYSTFLVVDFDRSSVNGMAAQISDLQITWTDSTSHRWLLDRTNGACAQFLAHRQEWLQRGTCAPAVPRF